MEQNIMYTPEGVVVVVTKILEEGYLGSVLYSYDEPIDIDYIDDDCIGKIEYFEKLYPKPLTAHLSDAIVKLRAQRDEIEKEVDELDQKRQGMELALAATGQFPWLKQALDYLIGNYEYVVRVDNLQVSRRGAYYTQKLQVNNLPGNNNIRLIENDYTRDADPIIRIFNTIEEVGEFCRKVILGHLGGLLSQKYSSPQNVNTYMSSIHNTCPVLFGHDITQAVNETIAELDKRVNTTYVNQLRTEINKKSAELQKIEQKLGINEKNIQSADHDFPF